MTTTRSIRQLARKALDARFAGFRSRPADMFATPRGGWIRSIREALGMPRHELGRRMGVGEQRVAQLERGEVEGKLTMDALKRAADALDCELLVALLPRRPLEQTLTDRRAQLASEWLRSNSLHTMALENQAVSVDALPSQLLREIEDRFPDTRLWDRP
ncbi:mobile mystery protein A [Luteimonas sp. 100069]|uniref:mobile mystery protein A n=1 Tax=Luteimonas sp. 100069 TaxID=2006109 RepID=UPI000F4D850F|nr:mobile mystery protein A [Luteimonas sp. 100069]RPD87657.1 mobile mystery protein A [Luteimonas sp. 100069]